MSEPNEPEKETARVTLPPGASSGAPGETARTDLPKPEPDKSKQAAAPIPQQLKPVAPPPISGPPMPTPPPWAPVRPPLAPPLSPHVPSARLTREIVPDQGEIAPGPIAPMPPRPRVLPPAPQVLRPTVPSPGVSAAPANYPGSAPQTGPRKETARISTEPERPPPGVKISTTQPSLTIPPAVETGSPVMTRRPVGPIEVAPGVTPTGADAIPMPLIWAAFGISAVALIIQIWNYFAS